jgi:hypothetical protein
MERPSRRLGDRRGKRVRRWIHRGGLPVTRAGSNG